MSTTPDIAKTGTSENRSHLLDIVSQRPLKAEVRYLVDGKTSTTTFPLGSLQRMVELSRCAAMRFMARNPLGSRGRLTAWANGIGWPVHEKAQVPVPSFPAIP